MGSVNGVETRGDGGEGREVFEVWAGWVVEGM